MTGSTQVAARSIAILGLLASAAGCGSLPPQEERATTPAPPSRVESALVRVAGRSVPDPTATGFRVMPHGLYALDARIELIRRARLSLDVQYYLIADDRTGRLFMRSLRDAALRGVRVRLLVDDLYTAGSDPMFAGLAAFDNVEVRLFNPFCCARQSLVGRFAASLADWRRLNHRMHNKLLVADEVIAVMGGRNIADEYFARGAASNFVDMDVLVVGAVVPQLRAIFDMYWDSRQAYSVASIVDEPSDRRAARERFDRLVDEGDQMRTVAVPPVDMLAQRPLGLDIDGGDLVVRLGKAIAFADPPGKVMATSGEMARAMSVQMNIMDRVVLSTTKVVISSPYFIPGADGVQAFAELRQRGVEVIILTNSLASNDEPVVHIGYARYRASLVRAGVDLYELSPGGLRHDAWDVFPGFSLGRLHAKTAVIDGKLVYIGSMNLDPRSDTTNTELGILAECPALAHDIVQVIDAARRNGAYRVQFGPDGESLVWHGMGERRDVVLSNEPEVSALTYFRSMLLGPFVPERLL